jgi:hypothetical protein
VILMPGTNALFRRSFNPTLPPSPPEDTHVLAVERDGSERGVSGSNDDRESTVPPESPIRRGCRGGGRPAFFDGPQTGMEPVAMLGIRIGRESSKFRRRFRHTARRSRQDMLLAMALTDSGAIKAWGDGVLRPFDLYR